MIFEEKKSILKPRSDSSFLEFLKEYFLPHIFKYNGTFICLLQGMIGKSSNEFILISYFQDLDSWKLYSNSNPPSNESILYEENTLIKSISSDALMSINKTNLKNIYGFREFIINREDIDTFVESSEKGIWPRMKSQGGDVLGLWCNLSSSHLTRILLITGYDNVSHWEATRSTSQYGLSFPHVHQVSKELTKQETSLRKKREDITITTTVNLMQNVNLK